MCYQTGSQFIQISVKKLQNLVRHRELKLLLTQLLSHPMVNYSGRPIASKNHP